MFKGNISDSPYRFPERTESGQSLPVYPVACRPLKNNVGSVKRDFRCDNNKGGNYELSKH